MYRIVSKKQKLISPQMDNVNTGVDTGTGINEHDAKLQPTNITQLNKNFMDIYLQQTKSINLENNKYNKSDILTNHFEKLKSEFLKNFSIIFKIMQKYQMLIKYEDAVILTYTRLSDALIR